MFAGLMEGEVKNRRRNEMLGNVVWGRRGRKLFILYVKEGQVRSF